MLAGEPELLHEKTEVAVGLDLVVILRAARTGRRRADISIRRFSSAVRRIFCASRQFPQPLDRSGILARADRGARNTPPARSRIPAGWGSDRGEGVCARRSCLIIDRTAGIRRKPLHRRRTEIPRASIGGFDRPNPAGYTGVREHKHLPYEFPPVYRRRRATQPWNALPPIIPSWRRITQKTRMPGRPYGRWPGRDFPGRPCCTVPPAEKSTSMIHGSLFEFC